MVLIHLELIKQHNQWIRLKENKIYRLTLRTLSAPRYETDNSGYIYTYIYDFFHKHNDYYRLKYSEYNNQIN
jgi:hypothetical protein